MRNKAIELDPDFKQKVDDISFALTLRGFCNILIIR